MGLVIFKESVAGMILNTEEIKLPGFEMRVKKKEYQEIMRIQDSIEQQFERERKLKDSLISTLELSIVDLKDEIIGCNSEKVDSTTIAIDKKLNDLNQFNKMEKLNKSWIQSIKLPGQQ
ncbi:hypothetical protein GVT53_16900 [Flagellimonas oceani]|uniref:Uncharacterized protein n=2 Tax=Flagellimonas oceani TaxID=2698672 RepID=A0A6G7J6U0_9FLAO|nr:hypothetical protein [Allomuricauda oceani]QII46288.1 hypothetical protein GVT53_16900 [Allomuricauda oceani]